MGIDEIARRVRRVERSARLRSLEAGGWRITTDDDRELGRGIGSREAWAAAYAATHPAQALKQERTA